MHVYLTIFFIEGIMFHQRDIHMSVQVLKISLSMQLGICTTALLQLINLMHYIQNDFSAHLFAHDKFI